MSHCLPSITPIAVPDIIPPIPFFGEVPILRNRVFWRLDWIPPVLGKYLSEARRSASNLVLASTYLLMPVEHLTSAPEPVQPLNIANYIIPPLNPKP